MSIAAPCGGGKSLDVDARDAGDDPFGGNPEVHDRGRRCYPRGKHRVGPPEEPAAVGGDGARPVTMGRARAPVGDDHRETEQLRGENDLKCRQRLPPVDDDHARSTGQEPGEPQAGAVERSFVAEADPGGAQDDEVHPLRVDVPGAVVLRSR